RRFCGLAAHQIDFVHLGSSLQTGVDSFQPGELHVGTNRQCDHCIQWRSSHRRDVADRTAHRFPSNPFRIGISQKMNPLDQAIRFQQLQATSRLDYCAIIACAHLDPAIQTERPSQSSDDSVFSEFPPLHLLEKKTPTKVTALKSACMAIGTSSEPDNS